MGSALGEGATNRVLSLDALRSFVAICETGTFRRAAGRLNKSPSAVSVQIANLEEQLGARLLDRDARHVTLTDHGDTLLRQARRMLGLNAETLALFRANPVKGRLRLSAPHDLGVSLVPKLLRNLAGLHPDLRIDVRLGASADVVAGIADGTADLILFNDVGPATLPARDLYSEPLKWLALKGGEAPSRAPLPLAVAEAGCAWRDAALEALRQAGRSYLVAYSSDTSMGQVAALRADLAIAALPASLADRDLAEVPAQCNLPPLPLTHIRATTDGSELANTCVRLIAEEMPNWPRNLV